VSNASFHDNAAQTAKAMRFTGILTSSPTIMAIISSPAVSGFRCSLAEARRQELAETDRQQHEHQDEREERE
jgi:hypothetical protein